MSIVEWFKGLFGNHRNQDNQPPIERKRHKKRFIKCNILRFREGTYASDMGGSDYTTYYKVINGLVSKRTIKTFQKGELTDMFNVVELWSESPSSYVQVVKKFIGSHYRGSVRYKVILYRCPYEGKPRKLSLRI